MVLTPPLKRIDWRAATRVIASKYPPIDLYERVSSDPAVWDALIAAEMLTNPRLRNQVGEIRLVPPEERVSGPGASYVMAPFTHLNPKGGRFSDATHGAYYAADDLRVLVGRIDADLHDVEQLNIAAQQQVLDPVDYGFSRSFAQALRDIGSTGVHYPSVRRVGGRCVALFRPSSVGVPVQTKRLKYHWDGAAVRRYYDYDHDAWIDL